VAIAPGIDDPHDDAADEQGQGHDCDAAQILLAPSICAAAVRAPM
jgi:hypothetical protein